MLIFYVSGVADQLQTNYAGDLRNVLKAVFDINCPPEEVDDNDSDKDGCDSPTAVSGDNSSGDMNAEETESESGTETRTFGGRLNLFWDYCISPIQCTCPNKRTCPNERT